MVGKCSYVIHFVQPPGYPFERPLVCDVVHQEYSLGTPRVGADDGAEPALAARVPQLQLYALAIDQNYRRLVS